MSNVSQSQEKERSFQYPSVFNQIDPFVPLKDDPNFKPKLHDAEKVAKYKDLE